MALAIARFWMMRELTMYVCQARLLLSIDGFVM